MQLQRSIPKTTSKTINNGDIAILLYHRNLRIS